MCTDLTLYPDADADGYGVDGDTIMACLNPGEMRDGYARSSADCAPEDASRNPGADEICGDYVDDDCVGGDAECPTSELARLRYPEWDCLNGAAPDNVYGWAVFEQGNAYYQAGACFVFFEGLPGEFYVQRVNVERTSNAASCDQINGCTCPSLNGWPSYDRRLYAFTKGTDEPCSEVSIQDHGGEDQPVSSSCRKYLYQLHFYDIDVSYVAGSAEALDRRITRFPTVEIACAQDRPHVNLPFQSLMETPIRRNASWRPL